LVSAKAKLRNGVQVNTSTIKYFSWNSNTTALL
jgi:hypothetical protein